MATTENRPQGASPGEPEYETWKLVMELQKNFYTKREIAHALEDAAMTLMLESER